MATMLKQERKPPQFLFFRPKPVEVRRTVSGAIIVEPSSFELVAGGRKEPRHAGFTEREWMEEDAEDERTAHMLYRAVGYALLILAGIGLVVGMVVL